MAREYERVKGVREFLHQAGKYLPDGKWERLLVGREQRKLSPEMIRAIAKYKFVQEALFSAFGRSSQSRLSVQAYRKG